MTRDEATSKISTYIAPEGLPPIGSRLSYEDTQNAHRTCTILGYVTDRWGTRAVYAWERFDDEEVERCGQIEAHRLRDLPSGRGTGWRLALDLR